MPKKKRYMLAICILSLAVLILGVRAKSAAISNSEEYAIPEGYKGCAGVFYGTEHAPPLSIQDGLITYAIPSNGILETSSPLQFGWVNEKHSGFKETRFYYINSQGKKTRELNLNQDIHNMVTGGAAKVNRPSKGDKRSFVSFFVGTQEEAERTPACFSGTIKLIVD